MADAAIDAPDRISEGAATPVPDGAETDPALRQAAVQLDALARMREAGMAMVDAFGRLVTGKASEVEALAFDGVDLALAFYRVSRAVRQIIAMEQEISGLRETRRKAIIGRRKSDARKVMIRTVRQAADAADIDLRYSSLDSMLHTVCNDYDDYDDYDRGTQRAIVARLCNDLGIETDLSIWPDDDPAGPDADGDDEPAPSGAWRDIPDASSPVWRGAKAGRSAKGHDPP